MSGMSRVLLLNRRDGDVEASVCKVDESRLPEGDVLLDVWYSGLNYKDALAITGRGKIIRGAWPFVPGIDLAGKVRASDSEAYKPGDLVIGTGWGLGESHWGGYAEVQRVDAAKLLPLPKGMSLEKAMLTGTAGLTAMLAVMELEAHGVEAGKGEVLVTGASGGVGSFATGLLHEAGYRVAASTGSPDAHDWLGRLGAARIIEREALAAGAARPLDSGEWLGAVDVVGGKTLEALLSRLKRHGTAVACGLAGGHALHTTVFPFILRGVRLIGVDTNTCPVPMRRQAWERLTRWLTDDLAGHLLADTIGLDDLPSYSERLLSGEIRGRLLVDVRK